MEHRRAPGLGFSLIELILMIVIIGIAINVSVPKMNRSAHSASTKVLQMDLAQLYSASELYTVEHDGKAPDQNIKKQLTRSLRTKINSTTHESSPSLLQRLRDD